MAFLTIAWQSDTLNSCDFTDLPCTGKQALAGSQSSQGRLFVSSNSISKLVAVNRPIINLTRSATRNQRLQRAIASSSALKLT